VKVGVKIVSFRLGITKLPNCEVPSLELGRQHYNDHCKFATETLDGRFEQNNVQLPK